MLKALERLQASTAESKGLSWQMSVQDYLIAARLPAYPIIGLPIFIGTCFGVQALSLWQQIVLHFNGLLLMSHILFLNDFADEETDKLNVHYFNSGGSRVVVDGKLTGRQLYLAALLVGAVEVLLAWYSMWEFDLVLMPMFALVGCSFGWLYSIEPFKLSYKGWGELVQGLSLGLYLPMLGYYFANGSLRGYPYHTALVMIPVFYSSNIVHALPDFPSDKLSCKVTHVVLHGEFSSRKHIIISYFISTLLAVLFSDDGSKFVGLLCFDMAILGVVRWYNLFHLARIANDPAQSWALHMFVRLNMFAMLGHLSVWMYIVCG